MCLGLKSNSKQPTGRNHAKAEAAHGTKHPSPMVHGTKHPSPMVDACATPRLATRAAHIIAAILAWLVPAALSTHRGLCCARWLLPCAVHLSPLAFFLVPTTPMALLATAFGGFPAGSRLHSRCGFHRAGSRLHSRNDRLHPRNRVVGSRSNLWRRGRSSLWRRGRSSSRDSLWLCRRRRRGRNNSRGGLCRRRRRGRNSSRGGLWLCRRRLR